MSRPQHHDSSIPGRLTFSDRLEIPFLLHLSEASFKTSQRLRLLILVTWSVGGLRILRLLLSSGDTAEFARLLTLLLSIVTVVANAAAVTWRLNAPDWKRIHDERIKLWTWHVTAVGCLIGSVLFKEGENDMATPFGNSVLLSVTLIFDQIRLHISAKLMVLQLLSLQLMEFGHWYSMADVPAGTMIRHAIRDTAGFILLGGIVPLIYLAGMEARMRLKFLRQHGAVGSLQPFWRRVLQLQAFNLPEH